MPRIRRTVNGSTAALVSFLFSALSAVASGDINCVATDGSGAFVNIAVGHLPVLAVLGATASDGVETWSTRESADSLGMTFGQGFMDDRQVLVDFTDPNVEQVVVSLRLFQVSGDKSFAEAGVLSFAGGSVFPVQCENG